MFYRRSYTVLAWVALALIIFAFIMVEINIRKAFMEIALSKAQLKGYELINEAVLEQTANGVNYRDLVEVHKDSEGHVVMLQPVSSKMNLFVARTIIGIQRRFNQRFANQVISVPMGQLFGKSLLAAYGPSLDFRMLPVGRIRVEWRDRFDSAGINQTRHSICLDVSARIKIVAPYSDQEITVKSVVPVTEMIIVGQVPKTYVNLSGGVKALPLKID